MLLIVLKSGDEQGWIGGRERAVPRAGVSRRGSLRRRVPPAAGMPATARTIEPDIAARGDDASGARVLLYRSRRTAKEALWNRSRLR